MPAGVVVTTDDTCESLKTALHNLNEKAKAERRRGYAGVHGCRYASLHAAMDPVLDGLLFRQRLGLK